MSGKRAFSVLIIAHLCFASYIDICMPNCPDPLLDPKCCQGCHTSCGSWCIGSTSNSCISCKVGFKLDIETLECVANCDADQIEVNNSDHPQF